MRYSLIITSILFTVIAISTTNLLKAQELITSKNDIRPYVTTISEEAFIIPPKPTNYLEIQKSIVYPVSCRRLGIEGKVMVKILVDKKGNASKFELINNLHPEINAACKEKILGLTFVPAIDQHGTAVERWTVVPIHFKLSI